MAVSVDSSTIKAGENSGNQALDDAASHWLKALGEQDPTATSTAERHVAATCARLGIALGRIIPAG